MPRDTRPARYIELNPGAAPPEGMYWGDAIARGDASAADRRDALRARAGDVGEAAEPLACPACRARYDFGDACPDCDVRLVGESALGLVAPEPARVPRLDLYARAVLCFAGLAAVAGLLLFATG